MKDIELPLLSKNEKTTATQNAKFQKVTSNFKYFTFLNMLPVAKSINIIEGPITSHMLPPPEESFNIENKIDLIGQLWEQQKQTTNSPSLLKCILKGHQKELINAIIVTFFLLNSHLISSLSLGKIIQIISSSAQASSVDISALTVITIIFIISFFFAMALENTWGYACYRTGASIRLSITGLLYRKFHSITLSSLQAVNMGKVINLLANDVNDIDQGLIYIPSIVLAPYSLGLSFLLISYYFGAFSLITMGIQSIILLSAACLSSCSKGPRNERNRVTDQRIKFTNEFLENIRLIKLYAWDVPLRKIISTLRNTEVQLFNKIARIDVISRTLTESCTYVCLLITCICYVLGGGILSPEKVYTVTLILQFSRFWVNMCTHIGLSFVVSAKLLSKRLEEVMEIKDITKSMLDNQVSDSKVKVSTNITFKNFTAYWSEKSEKPCLKNINLAIDKGSLTTVIGKIGSGKTSLLLSFLKEIPVVEGQLNFDGSIAYVEQEPIIFSNSIRENILFGREYDETFYLRVLKACNLDADLKQFHQSDQTLVGERGVTLSGGQKARISLARALYAQNDIYLLDDPLSAVDIKVGKVIFEKGIKEFLKGKTVILVTHHLNYAKEADKVIVMEEGCIKAEGKFDNLTNMNIDLLQFLNRKEEEEEPQLSKQDDELTRRKSSYQRKPSSLSENDSILNHKKESTKEEESHVTSRATYINYLKESQDYLLGFSVIAFYCLANIFVIALTKSIGYWAQIQDEAYNLSNSSEEDSTQLVDNSYYIKTNILFVICMILCNYVKVFVTIKFLLETNTKLHEKILYKISKTFVHFFDSTPIGVILNRFSNDIGVLDKASWPIIFDVLNLFTAFGLFMVYLCYINFWVLPPSIAVMYSLYKVKLFFVKPIVQLKRLDLISRSPIYSEISSTLNGLLTIRVYQQSQRFIKNFSDLVYISSKTLINYTRMNRIFSVSLQGLLYLQIVFGVMLFIYIASHADIEVGVFGLALYYLVYIANESAWAIRQAIVLDINMQSAQRIQQYCVLNEEYSPATLPPKLPNKSSNWPYSGGIVFKNVYLKYPGTRKYVLNGLNFVIEPGCKVGIVGRTGAGKSSIIQGLFRMVEIEDLKDSCIEIDGVNIRNISLEILRGSLSILPQTPVIFTGTIRRNLDPFNQFSDRELYEALSHARLKDYVMSLEGGLETDMSMSSSIFSAGQKQLVCLARVILRKSKIVILDEATANVDMSTDAVIQEMINEHFKESTVITIAHRLSTIAHYDKVLVLEKGMVVEYDHPYRLLVDSVGDRSITKKNGVFAKMVTAVGETEAKDIFNKTYFAFQK